MGKEKKHLSDAKADDTQTVSTVQHRHLQPITQLLLLQDHLLLLLWYICTKALCSKQLICLMHGKQAIADWLVIKLSLLLMRRFE